MLLILPLSFSLVYKSQNKLLKIKYIYDKFAILTFVVTIAATEQNLNIQMVNGIINYITGGNFVPKVGSRVRGCQNQTILSEFLVLSHFIVCYLLCKI
jgi:hypothetical protein